MKSYKHPFELISNFNYFSSYLLFINFVKLVQRNKIMISLRKGVNHLTPQIICSVILVWIFIPVLCIRVSKYQADNCTNQFMGGKYLENSTIRILVAYIPK